MVKCKSDFKGCCSNINGECIAWFSCGEQEVIFTEKEKKEIEEIRKSDTITLNL